MYSLSGTVSQGATGILSETIIPWIDYPIHFMILNTSAFCHQIPVVALSHCDNPKIHLGISKSPVGWVKTSLIKEYWNWK